MKMRISQVLIFAVTLMTIGGCLKDTPPTLNEDEAIVSEVVSIENAKRAWDANVSTQIVFRDGIETATLHWDRAVQTQFRGEEDIVLVPFDLEGLEDVGQRGQLFVVFYHHPDASMILMRIWGYYAPDYQADFMPPLQVQDFTGYIFNVASNGEPFNIFNIERGSVIGFFQTGRPIEGVVGENVVSFRCDDFYAEVADTPSSPRWYCCNVMIRACCCPNPSGSGNGSGNGSGGGLGAFFSSIVNAIRDSPGSGDGPSTFTSIFWPSFGSNPSGGDGGGTGGGNRLEDFFNADIFAQAPDPARVEAIEKFRAENCPTLSTNVLFGIVSPFCFDEPDSFDECAQWSMLRWLEAQTGLADGQLGTDDVLACGLNSLIVASYQVEPDLTEQFIRFINENITEDGFRDAVTSMATVCLNSPVGIETCLDIKMADFEVTEFIDFIDGIQEIQQPIGAVVRANRPLCPRMFQFSDVLNDHGKISAGISNVTIGLMIPNAQGQRAEVPYTFGHVYFATERGITENCLDSPADIAASSFMDLINGVGDRIASGLGHPGGVRFTVASELFRNFKRRLRTDCVPHQSRNFYSVVDVVSLESRNTRREQEGTIFLNFAVLFGALCN